MDFDERHAKTIVKTIGETEDVKAIIIVVNGSSTRMDSTLANVLYHITTVLPKAVLDNIFLVMTNVSNMLFANFDIAELQKEFGIKVKDSCCIENPFVSLERSRKKGNLIGDAKVTKALYRSFCDARDEFMELIQKIEGCKVVESRKFTELASLKEAVERNILSTWADCDKVKIIMDQIRQFENEVMKAENIKDINMKEAWSQANSEAEQKKALLDGLRAQRTQRE